MASLADMANSSFQESKETFALKYESSSDEDEQEEETLILPEAHLTECN